VGTSKTDSQPPRKSLSPLLVPQLSRISILKSISAQ
jgi:hypothetical protein